MFKIRFWPMTARPIRAMSAFGSISVSVLVQDASSKPQDTKAPRHCEKIFARESGQPRMRTEQHRKNRTTQERPTRGLGPLVGFTNGHESAEPGSDRKETEKEERWLAGAILEG